MLMLSDISAGVYVLFIYIWFVCIWTDYPCSGIFLVILLRALAGNVSDPLKNDKVRANHSSGMSPRW